MVKEMENCRYLDEENDSIPNRIVVEAESVPDLDLSSFVYAETMQLFEILDINTDFLSINAEYWPEDDNYKNGCEVVHELAVINDAAERLIKMIQDYEGKLTEDQEGLFTVVELHRNLVQFKCDKRYEELSNFLDHLQ